VRTAREFVARNMGGRECELIGALQMTGPAERVGPCASGFSRRLETFRWERISSNAARLSANEYVKERVLSSNAARLSANEHVKEQVRQHKSAGRKPKHIECVVRRVLGTSWHGPWRFASSVVVLTRLTRSRASGMPGRRLPTVATIQWPLALQL
jgi:hypothetical protein